MTTNYDDVRELYKKHAFVQPDTPGPLKQYLLMQRTSLMLEELGEFARAANSRDFVKQADALVDLVYFALGTASMMGLPWQELWADVHKVNMTKKLGKTKRNFAKDLMKAAIEPDTESILIRYDYDEKRYAYADGDVADERCRG